MIIPQKCYLQCSCGVWKINRQIHWNHQMFLWNILSKIGSYTVQQKILHAPGNFWWNIESYRGHIAVFHSVQHISLCFSLQRPSICICSCPKVSIEVRTWITHVMRCKYQEMVVSHKYKYFSYYHHHTTSILHFKLWEIFWETLLLYR